MILRELTLEHRYGLHARPSDRLAKESARFESTIEINWNGERINAKSVINLLSLGIPRGGKFTLLISGSDEKEAEEALVGLISRNFDIEEE